jgi:hypothetical protein
MEPKFHESQEIPSTLNGNLGKFESLRGTSQSGEVVMGAWGLYIAQVIDKRILTVTSEGS